MGPKSLEQHSLGNWATSSGVRRLPRLSPRLRAVLDAVDEGVRQIRVQGQTAYEAGDVALAKTLWDAANLVEHPIGEALLIRRCWHGREIKPALDRRLREALASEARNE